MTHICPSCDGRLCMSCVSGEEHEQCRDDCPMCCEVSYCNRCGRPHNKADKCLRDNKSRRQSYGEKLKTMLDRRVEGKIQKKLTQIRAEYETAEDKLTLAIDRWLYLESLAPFQRTTEQLESAGSDLAEASNDILKFYRWDIKGE